MTTVILDFDDSLVFGLRKLRPVQQANCLPSHERLSRSYCLAEVREAWVTRPDTDRVAF